jgi:hypothetical protein
MNDTLAELLHGAGLGDIVIPRKDFIKEHKHLVSLLNRYDIPALKKEAKDQSDELREMTGGFTKSSGFIRRLMAENALKHKGQYKKPTYPLAVGSTMNKPAEFDYRKIANSDQRGINESDYGASPFIQKHFGLARAVPFERKRGVPLPTEPFKTKRKSKKQTQESEQQREARKAFVAVEPEAPPEEVVVAPQPAVAPADKYGKEALKEYLDLYFKYHNEPLKEFRPQKGGIDKGANCVWFGMTNTKEKGKYGLVYIDPPFKIKPGINLRTVKSEYRRPGEGTGDTIIPNAECVLTDGDGDVKIDSQSVKAVNLRDYSQGWHFSNHMSDVMSIHITLTTDKEKEKVNYEGRYGSYTRNKTLSFYLKELYDIQHKYYIGWRAAMINYGPREVYKTSDAKQSYSMNREKTLSEREMIEYKESIDKDLANEGKYGKYSLTINGVEYVSYPKE